MKNLLQQTRSNTGRMLYFQSNTPEHLDVNEVAKGMESIEATIRETQAEKEHLTNLQDTIDGRVNFAAGTFRTDLEHYSEGEALHPDVIDEINNESTESLQEIEDQNAAEVGAINSSFQRNMNQFVVEPIDQLTGIAPVGRDSSERDGTAEEAINQVNPEKTTNIIGDALKQGDVSETASTMYN